VNRVAALLDRLGRAVMENIEETGKIFLLFISVLAWMFYLDTVCHDTFPYKKDP
jgi:hypothetical protein